MLRKEEKYEFRSQLLQIHKKNIINPKEKPQVDDFIFTNGIVIAIPEDAEEVVKVAAKDFIDFLLTSLNISACLSYQKEGASITASLGKNLGKGEGYMGFRVSVSKDGIEIKGYDYRGIAQAFYHLEDRLGIRRAPYIKFGATERKALFSPRITQSPYGMYDFSDHAFAQMAHKGYDAISLWIKDAYSDKRGNALDINFIAQRAARYGIDVYFELYAPHEAHPDDEGAQEYYDKLYGDIWKVCPLLKGIELTGEANQFRSRDKRAGKAPASANFVENIPTGKVSPGWYPCNDYPAWAELVRNAVKKARPDAEVIFCTYNWGFAPEKERIELIENLPDGITVQATWDMFHKYQLGDSVEDICDYTLSFVGPGEYFASEAKAAKKKGLKVSSITNASGKTWDFGVIPFEPMPQQWIRRYEKMRQAHVEWGLGAMLENIHYGFYPSIVSEIEKQAFSSLDTDLNEVLRELAERDFEENADIAIKAMDHFSDAIQHYIPTNEDQYGAFRIGPAYPLWSQEERALPVGLMGGGKRPSKPNAMFGNCIYFGTYTIDNGGKSSLPGVRIYDEIASLEKMLEKLNKGIDLLASAVEPNENLLKLKNMAEFMRNTCITAVHVKKHYIIKQKLSIIGDKKQAEKLIDEMEAILIKERQNAVNTIPLVQVDSRLGYEPSMDYVGDEDSILWKIRQVDYELEYVLPKYRLENSLKA